MPATISHFSFVYPIDHCNDIDAKNQSKSSVIDADGDLIVERRRRGVIQIEHQQSTNLSLVGLQVWRGALLLGDFLLHNRWTFENKRILELGSGVGLSSKCSILWERAKNSFFRGCPRHFDLFTFLHGFICLIVFDT